ncbi:hypothetical protein L6452_00057 [Arctium lappa]|uniref:Uncharacterized protein n=1 Tax=Arctium lappa TaxID=4217 RepID=A0ACB9FDN1_ARCLA|nr:hypothetical protein L6452_00057 [Arctium lappa]
MYCCLLFVYVYAISDLPLGLFSAGRRKPIDRRTAYRRLLNQLRVYKNCKFVCLPTSLRAISVDQSDSEIHVL